MYDRPKVSEVFLKNMERLGVKVVAAVSDEKSAEVCRINNTVFRYSQNSPLGNKWNESVRLALIMENWTHLLITGDDDLYTDEFLKRVEENQREPFLGIESCYMIKPSTNQALEFRYGNGVALGGGRVLRREVVEKVGDMYEPSALKSIDHYADLVLMEAGYMPVIIDKDKPLCVSLKTGKNIWNFENFVGNKEARAVTYEEATSILTESEQQLISEL